MTLEEAEAIYENPSGHTKEELIECLSILNAQENILSPIQYEAIKDAHNRLGIPITDILDS